MIKIQIVGTTGSGKSILAEMISDALSKLKIDSVIEDDTPHPIEQYKYIQLEQFKNKQQEPIIIETVGATKNENND